MAGRLITVGGVLLAGLVAVGTGLYVHGIEPPFPQNAWAFDGLFGLSVAYALLFGRSAPGGRS